MSTFLALEHVHVRRLLPHACQAQPCAPLCGVVHRGTSNPMEGMLPGFGAGAGDRRCLDPMDHNSWLHCYSWDRYLCVRSRSARTTMTTMAKGRGYGVIPGVLQDSGERSGYRRQRAQMCQRGVRSLTPDASSRVRLDAMNTSRQRVRTMVKTAPVRIPELVTCQKVCFITPLQPCEPARPLRPLRGSDGRRWTPACRGRAGRHLNFRLPPDGGSCPNVAFDRDHPCPNVAMD